MIYTNRIIIIIIILWTTYVCEIHTRNLRNYSTRFQTEVEEPKIRELTHSRHTRTHDRGLI